MQQKLLILALLFITHCTHIDTQDRYYKNSVNAIVVDNKIQSPLAELLKIQKITHDGTLPDIIAKTQQKWLRPADKERWELDFQEITPEYWRLFEEMELTQEITPSKKHYRYLLLLGARYARVKSRLLHAKKLWLNGVRWDHVVLLGGERALVPSEIEEIQKEHGTSATPKTEHEMEVFVYEHLDLPHDMRATTLSTINAPMISDGKGGFKRPTTQDTFDLWLKTSPKPGDCIAISDQPFITFQHTAAVKSLPPSFPLETVGEAVQQKGNLAIYLDVIARILYQVREK